MLAQGWGAGKSRGGLLGADTHPPLAHRRPPVSPAPAPLPKDEPLSRAALLLGWRSSWTAARFRGPSTSRSAQAALWRVPTSCAPLQSPPRSPHAPPVRNIPWGPSCPCQHGGTQPHPSQASFLKPHLAPNKEALGGAQRHCSKVPCMATRLQGAAAPASLVLLHPRAPTLTAALWSLRMERRDSPDPGRGKAPLGDPQAGGRKGSDCPTEALGVGCAGHAPCPCSTGPGTLEGGQDGQGARTPPPPAIPTGTEATSPSPSACASSSWDPRPEPAPDDVGQPQAPRLNEDRAGQRRGVGRSPGERGRPLGGHCTRYP